VITSFYDTNNREYSMISMRDIDIYRDTWSKFAQSSPNDKMRFGQLRPFTETLLLQKCRLGCRKADPAFSKIEIQCRMAAQSMLSKKDDPFDDTILMIDYRELIVYLAANLFPPDAVTVVDLMLREQSRQAFDILSLAQDTETAEPPPPPKSIKDFMYSMRKAPTISGADSDEESLDGYDRLEAKVGLSYNLFQVLEDMLSEGLIEEEHYTRLKALIDEDNEFLALAWEEYAEEPRPSSLRKFKSKAVKLVRNPVGHQHILPCDVLWIDYWDRVPKRGARRTSVTGEMIGSEASEATHRFVQGLAHLPSMCVDQHNLALIAQEASSQNTDPPPNVLHDVAECAEAVRAGNLAAQSEAAAAAADEPLDLERWGMCWQCHEPVSLEWHDCPACGVMLQSHPTVAGMAPTRGEPSGPTALFQRVRGLFSSVLGVATEEPPAPPPAPVRPVPSFRVQQDVAPQLQQEVEMSAPQAWGAEQQSSGWNGGLAGAEWGFANGDAALALEAYGIELDDEDPNNFAVC